MDRRKVLLAVQMILAGMGIFGLAGRTLQAGKPEPPRPDSFLIGRRTYFDFGPPFDYYEVFSARAADGGTAVERIQLTPPADVCRQAPTIETAVGSLKESVSELLGKTNPCAIPAKQLNRERKRCKNCLNFSGADVVMQVPCGSETRRIRMEVLDHDMFDAHPGTPENTSWTMKLLSRLDQVLGSTIMERPAFTLVEPPPTPTPHTTPLLRDLQNGALDSLFEKSTYTPSELFRQSQIPPRRPAIDLVESSPVRPITYKLPDYPSIARLAHVSGLVKFTVNIKPDGHTSSPVFSSGNPLLQKAVEVSVANWQFPIETAGQEVRLAVDFNLNCPTVKTGGH